MNLSSLRYQEYIVLFYRIAIAFLFYFIARVLFVMYNNDLVAVDSFSQFVELAYVGLTFDRISILYASSLFIIFSILPTGINTTPYYQKFLFALYFVPQLVFYAFNYADLIYYKFIFSRSTIAVLDSIENEGNKLKLFFNFVIDYWHVFILFFLFSFCWIFLYNLVKVKYVKKPYSVYYFLSSVIVLVVVVAGVVIGIRGGVAKNIRPLNIIDASRFVNKPVHADVVLNSPFCILRTINKTSFVKLNISSDADIENYVKPIKQYDRSEQSRPNIVLFITESFGREYLGAFNQDTSIPNYKSYTPFLDSLAQHSLIFTNAFANGYKSIHGMSSVLAGIPSFKDAFTSSPYPNQQIESLVSVFKSLEYETSFFHGAPNGSMGFQGFCNILGVDKYYGMSEFDDASQFDGTWGIWDEAFFLFMKKELDKETKPFFATHFSVSSHDPFKIPKKYDKDFPEGDIPIHKCVRYTDYSFKQFFEQAKKEPWFDNTLFVITADHCNQIYYDEYAKVMNRYAVPILFYKPDNSLTGVSSEIAQQIDIYPTLLEIVGYDKPFRSWGRSLCGGDGIKPFSVNYAAGLHNYQCGNYICSFNGKETVGIYSVTDLNLENNLVDDMNDEMREVELACKAFLQNYFNSIIERRL